MQTHQLPAAAPIFFISKHAARRMAQRSISNRQVEVLLSYGAAAPAGCRASMLTLDAETASDLLAEGFRPAEVDRLRRLKAIVSDDGTLITMMHRYSKPKCRRQRPMGEIS